MSAENLPDPLLSCVAAINTDTIDATDMRDVLTLSGAMLEWLAIARLKEGMPLRRS